MTRRAAAPRRGARVALLGVALALGACSGGSGGTPSTTATAATSSPSGSGRPSAAPRPPRLPQGLAADLRAVVEAHPDDEVAVSIGPVGPPGEVGAVSVATGPRPERLVAWSTIKVPLSLAAGRAPGGSGATRGTGTARAPVDGRADVEAALTASDNAAADRLWQGLGGGRTAAGAVEEALADGGDTRTRVSATASSPGFSPFGQTPWSLPDQVRYVAALPCLEGASAVTGPMGRVRADQRWVLGGIAGARVKGGWGPTPDGYVVRQVGLLPGADGGHVAVALQTRTSDYATGVATLDELAAVLAEHRAQLPGGTCG